MNFVYLAVLNINDPHPIHCLIIMGVFPLICIPVSFMVKADLRRLNATLAREQNHVENEDKEEKLKFVEQSTF